MKIKKLKVGDLVYIISNTTGGIHEIGTTGWVTEKDNDWYRVSPENDSDERGNNWYKEENLTLYDLTKADNVNHPSHYNKAGIECISAIRASLGDEFPAYCKGNVMKYLWRYQYKNGIEDLEKAQVYLNWMVEYLEENTE